MITKKDLKDYFIGKRHVSIDDISKELKLKSEDLQKIDLIIKELLEEGYIKRTKLQDDSYEYSFSFKLSCYDC